MLLGVLSAHIRLQALLLYIIRGHDGRTLLQARPKWSRRKGKKNYTLQSTLFPGLRTHKSQTCPPETYCGKAYRGANCFFFCGSLPQRCIPLDNVAGSLAVGSRFLPAFLSLDEPAFPEAPLRGWCIHSKYLRNAPFYPGRVCMNVGSEVYLCRPFFSSLVFVYRVFLESLLRLNRAHVARSPISLFIVLCKRRLIMMYRKSRPMLQLLKERCLSALIFFYFRGRFNPGPPCLRNFDVFFFFFPIRLFFSCTVLSSCRSVHFLGSLCGSLQVSNESC